MPKPTAAAPTAAQVLAELEPKRAEAVARIHAKHGAGERVLGVKLGDLRAIATRLKTQHALGLALWAEGWYETRVLATMLLDPKLLTEADATQLAESADTLRTLDKLTDYVLPKVQAARQLRDRWLEHDEPLLARAGWNLMTAEVEADAQGALDLDALLATIEAQLPAAPRLKKEAMNQCLAMIGIFHPAMTAKAIAAGERLGRWDDRPVPKGCTSSYPPEWIPAGIRLREARRKKE